MSDEQPLGHTALTLVAGALSAKTAVVRRGMELARRLPARARVVELRLSDLTENSRFGADDNAAEWELEWRKRRGDSVALDEPLVDVRVKPGAEAAALRSPVSGMLLDVLANERLAPDRLVALVDTANGTAAVRARVLVKAVKDKWDDTGPLQSSTPAALAGCDEAIALDEQCARAWYLRGAALFQMSEWTEVIEACERAVAISPSYALAWRKMGEALSELTRYEDALRCFKVAHEISPDNLIALAGMGGALVELGRFDVALSCFDLAVTVSRNDAQRAWGWCNKAEILYTLGRNEDALECADQAVEAQPADAYHHALRGYCLTDMRRFEDALKCYEYAASISPALEAPLVELMGLVLEELGRPPDLAKLEAKERTRRTSNR